MNYPCRTIGMTDALFRSDGTLGRNGQCFCAGSTVGDHRVVEMDFSQT